MNCNEKELKAKLYNNRAIAHFKLGKMMRALICIFLSSARALSSFSEKGDNFECMSKNKKSEKIYMPYLGLSNIQRAIHKFSLSYCVGGGFATRTDNQRYLFSNRKSPGFTEGCRSCQ